MLDLLTQREEAEPGLVLDLDFALVHLGLGEDEEAISRLEASVDARQAAAIYLWLWPQWERLHGHPRFERLIDRIRRGTSGP